MNAINYARCSLMKVLSEKILKVFFVFSNDEYLFDKLKC